MSSVGTYLRELRTQRGVSLEEIARSTRVMHSYLEALEGDDLAALPAPVFTKGFIRAYCQVLGVPPDAAFTFWEQRAGEGAEGGRTARPAQAPAAPAGERAKRREAESRSRGAVLAGFVMLVILGVALFAVTLWLQPLGEPRGGGNASAPTAEPQAAPSSAPRAVAPAQPPAAAEVAARPRPAAAAPAPAPGAEGPSRSPGVRPAYRLVARTSELTWMRVRTEEGRMSEENIPAGETREWVSDRPLVLSIGNAGGVALELNGRPIPRLGASGAVIERLIVPSAAP
jgi:cytoskeleton protein RodZ